MKDKLKSCPFCGCKAYLLKYVNSNGVVWYIVDCSKCHNRTTFEKSKNTVIEKWNRRVDNE